MTAYSALAYHRAVKTIHLPCTIFIASNLSKVSHFDLPHLHLACPLEVTPTEFCGDLWQQ